MTEKCPLLNTKNQIKYIEYEKEENKCAKKYWISKMNSKINDQCENTKYNNSWHTVKKIKNQMTEEGSERKRAKWMEIKEIKSRTISRGRMGDR